MTMRLRDADIWRKIAITGNYSFADLHNVIQIAFGWEDCHILSIVYKGIRFTYGLKSSEYDRFNFLHPDGTIEGGYGYAKKKDAISLVGGTVIVLSKTDGTIEDCYNYYCGFENGQIDWEQFKA